MSKVILISQFALPYSKIGSWTTLYGNYLNSEQHQIDYLICEQPEAELYDVNYNILDSSLLTKIKVRILKNTYIPYLKALKNILKGSNESYVIQIVDNFGLVSHLVNLLEKLGLRQQCYLQFFYHGFAPFFGNFQSRSFFNQIDEMVLLTYDSYRVHKDYYTILPCTFNVLHNGIDTTLFNPLNLNDKLILKKSMGLEEKQVFIWCSQDRPKKGLDFILKVWKLIIKKHSNIELIIVGGERKENIDGVHFIGRTPNVNLPQYFQAADCYLFPTLWHEGFGMSMIEALHCGCYVIASEIGGIPEVLNYGKYGTLIKAPHFIDDWVDAINNFITDTAFFKNKIPRDLYSTSKWNTEMNQLISAAKLLV